MIRKILYGITRERVLPSSKVEIPINRSVDLKPLASPKVMTKEMIEGF